MTNFTQNLIEFYNSYQILLPEALISLTLLFNLLILLFNNQKNSLLASILSIIGLVSACVALIINLPQEEILIFNELYLINYNNSIVKFLVLLSAILVYIFILFLPKKNHISKFAIAELPILMNFSLLGIILAISSNNFMILYLGLELSALPAYILTTIKRDDSYALEAGLKYFVLGVMASSIFLFGISLVYISTGSLSYEKIATYLMNMSEFSPLLMVGIALIMIGLLFKLAAAPMHAWLTDIYQGAHNIIVAFFAIAPKLGAAYIIFVLYHFVFINKYYIYNTQLLSFFAILSFLVGSIGAIKQTNFKRLIAYSSIASSGFILLNIIGDLTYSFTGLIVYSFSYMIAVYGLLAFIMFYWNEAETDKKRNFAISDMAGLSKKNPLLAMMISFLLFSIAGLPPFIGFLGKLYVMLAALSALHTTLVIGALLASVVALIYYLNIIKVMYFDESTDFTPANLTSYKQITIFYGICSLVSIIFFNFIIKIIFTAI